MPDPCTPSTQSLEAIMASNSEFPIASIIQTAQGLILNLRKIGSQTGEKLRELITDSISPEILFSKETSPHPSLWTDLRN